MEKNEIPAGHMRNAKGYLVPVELVRDQDKLVDDTVQRIMGFAADLSAQMGRFKGHTFDDVATCTDLLAELHGAARGGPKGNVTLTSFDGCQKVVLQVQDQITFGSELQIAKSILDEVIAGWTSDARSEVRTLVDQAFSVGDDGKINRALLFSLRRLNIEDEGWKRAMNALTDSIQVIGSAAYVRFYHRRNPDGQLDRRAPWKAIPIDLASVTAPPAASEPAISDDGDDAAGVNQADAA